MIEGDRVNSAVLQDFRTDMRLANLSPITIQSRLEVIDRLAIWLGPVELVDATTDLLLGFQRQFQHLRPASVDIYVRHVQAFYRWAALRHQLIEGDPAITLVRPRVPKGRPHPTSVDELRTIFACTTNELRLAYALAAFAGARCGEISRLQRVDIDMDRDLPTATLDGKGGKVRTVPLLEPVVAELLEHGLPRTGFIVTRSDGQSYSPDQLSLASCRHLQRLGVATTLHSMRHAFATTALRTSKDILLVRDLLGHESVATTEIYTEADPELTHQRLHGVTALANDALGRRGLYAVAPAGTRAATAG